MDLGLGGKVVVVTGGAKGIGAAIVRAAAAEGMTRGDRRPRRGREHDARRRASAAAGHQVEVVVASLDRAEACAAAVADGDDAVRADRRAGQQRRA